VRAIFLTHSFPRESGDPAGAFVLHLARALIDAGAAVRVLAPSAPGLQRDDTIDGVTVTRYRYSRRDWETLAYTGTMAEQVAASVRGKLALAGMVRGGRRAVRAAVTAFAPDIVHAHWWFPSGLSASGATRVPLVTTFHGSDVRLARRSRWAPMLFRRVMARSAAVTAVSGWLASEARLMVPELDALVEPMPVDVSLFTPLGVRAGGRFLYVGRLNAQKGIMALIEALAVTGGGASVDVVGDGPARGAAERLAVTLDVAKRMRWHGSLPQVSLVALYRNATAVVVPSEDEGLGLVAVEAQLCEAPVIAFRSGGLTDVVSDGVSGLLVAPGDVRGLAGAMDGLMQMADRGAAFGRAGRIGALARFAPAAVAARYLRIYSAASGRDA
jgi:glycosyltransferase involved in cell wall biosynthesis